MAFWGLVLWAKIGFLKREKTENTQKCRDTCQQAGLHPSGVPFFGKPQSLLYLCFWVSTLEAASEARTFENQLGVVDLHPQKLTWKPIRGAMKTTVPLKGGYMGFHVSLRECRGLELQHR